MKYVAILTFSSGSTSGVTVEAKNLSDAWQKLMPLIPTSHLQSVSMAEVSTNYEIR